MEGDMQIFLFFLFFISSLHSFEIDIDWLKSEIKNNPQETTQRVLLAHYYINQGNLSEAKKLINRVLSLDKEHKKANFLAHEIKELEQISLQIGESKLSKSKKLIFYLDNLHKNAKHKELTSKYELFMRNNVMLYDRAHFDAIKSYIYLKKYPLAFDIVENSSLSPQDKNYLKAEIHVAKGENTKSILLYLSALKYGDREDIVVGLYGQYIKNKNEKEAKKLFDSFNSNPTSQISQALKRKKSELTDKKIAYFKESYNQKDSFFAMQQYFFVLKDLGKKDESLTLLLNHNKKHPKDEQSLLFIAKNLYWNQKIKQSQLVLSPVIDKTNDINIIRLYKKIQRDGDLTKANSILKSAIIYHKKGDYNKALKQYRAYYEIVKDPKIAKEIAQLYFFQEKEQKSLFYYEQYLNSNPNDHKVRFSYASALDVLKEYKQSAMQYKSVAMIKDDLQTLALYRYANALMKQNETKTWNRSKMIFTKLKTKLEQQEKSKKRDDLLKHTKNALKIVSKPMPKPSRYRDITLGAGQKKILRKDITLVGIKIEKRDVSSIESLLKLDDSPKWQNLTLSMFSLQDSVIKNTSYGMRIDHVAQIAKGSLSLEAKRSTFKAQKKKQNVNTFLTHLNYRDFSVGVGVNRFKDFNDPIFALSYRKAYENHNLTFGLRQINGAFINNRACMIDNKLNAIEFSVYDAILLPTLEQTEVSVKIGKYDNGIHVNSWVDYPVSKFLYRDFENILSFSGSYEYNSKQGTCYESAHFFDGSFMQIKPKIYLSDRGFIQGIGAVGYSLENSDILYNYGLVIGMRVYGDFDLRVNCRHYQSGYSPRGADECYASLSYIW